MGDGFRVSQIDHVELWVPDQRAAARWYEDVLGLETIPEFEHWSDGGPLMIATAEAGTKLALFAGQPGPAQEGRTPAYRRVAFRVNAEGFVSFLRRLDTLELVADGGGRLEAGDVVDHGESRSIYFRDPWGHAIEITTYAVDGLDTLIESGS